MTMNVRMDDVFNIRITGAHLAVIVQGLGELQHKVAGSVEQHLIEEVQKSKTPAQPPMAEVHDSSNG